MTRQEGGAAASEAAGVVEMPGASGLPDAGGILTAPRSGAADPVKALMHQHRALCERAVDPLEIAAALEAHGVTDRAAGRYRHRDVFALAEEMYARVPRGDDDSGGWLRPGTAARIKGLARPGVDVHAGWALFALLPGAVCAAAVAGLGATTGGARLAVVLGGALAVALALRAALRNGPLRTVTRLTPATRAWVCWLLAYALLGDALLAGAVSGGPDEPGELWQPATATLLGLALAVAPAAWCARLFAVRAGRRLRASRRLDEFTASARPLLLGVVALFLATLGALLAATEAVLGAAPGDPPALAEAGALGALLLLARLLGVHGFTRAPALLLGAAGTCEVASLALVFTGRLPGCDAAAAPVTAAVDTWGPGAVPTAACGTAALALLIHAARTLPLASVHAGGDWGYVGGASAHAGGASAQVGGASADVGGAQSQAGSALVDVDGALPSAGCTVPHAGSASSHAGCTVPHAGGASPHAGRVHAGGDSSRAGRVHAGGDSSRAGSVSSCVGGAQSCAGSASPHAGGVQSCAGSASSLAGGALTRVDGVSCHARDVLADVGGILAHAGGASAHASSVLADVGGTPPHAGSASPHTEPALPQGGADSPHAGGALVRAGSASADISDARRCAGGTSPDAGSALAHAGSASPHVSSTSSHVGSASPHAGALPQVGGAPPHAGGPSAHAGGASADLGGLPPRAGSASAHPDGAPPHPGSASPLPHPDGAPHHTGRTPAPAGSTPPHAGRTPPPAESAPHAKAPPHPHPGPGDTP
ncbi:hypothetical protein [Streptomyces sp. NPDC018059]|uniref:hypothetical protein n=1 Tax=Streptomyces sp. NPDC018059 TaxID=3365041 RepID=UPI00378F28AC